MGWNYRTADGLVHRKVANTENLDRNKNMA